MKRCVIIVAVTAGLLWNADFASAQYRTRAPHNTMSGHNATISGHNLTNHNHLTPQRVGVTSYPVPYAAGRNGGFLPGTSVYPGNYYNPPYSSGTSGFNSFPGWRGR